jgi:hypothetical protein
VEMPGKLSNRSESSETNTTTQSKTFHALMKWPYLCAKKLIASSYVKMAVKNISRPLKAIDIVPSTSVTCASMALTTKLAKMSPAVKNWMRSEL